MREGGPQKGGGQAADLQSEHVRPGPLWAVRGGHWPAGSAVRSPQAGSAGRGGDSAGGGFPVSHLPRCLGATGAEKPFCGRLSRTGLRPVCPRCLEREHGRWPHRQGAISLTLPRTPTLQTGKRRHQGCSGPGAQLAESCPSPSSSLSAPAPAAEGRCRPASAVPLQHPLQHRFPPGFSGSRAGSRLPCQNFLPRRGPSPTSFLPPASAPPRPAGLSLGSAAPQSGWGSTRAPRPVLLRATRAVPTPGRQRGRTPSR